MPRDLLAPKQPRDLLAPQPGSVSDAILPFSGPPGQQHFDSQAGLLGSILRTLSLPGEVYRGEVPTQVPDAGTSPELIQRSAEAGAVMSPVPAPVRAGGRAIEGVARAMRRQEAAVPTRPELKAATDAGYKTARGLGVDYRGSAVGNMAEAIKQQLMREGIHPEDASLAYAKLDNLASPPPGANSSFTELESARKSFGNIAYDDSAAISDTERKAAKSAISAIDDFFENPTPQSVLAGPAAAKQAIMEAITSARRAAIDAGYTEANANIFARQFALGDPATRTAAQSIAKENAAAVSAAIKEARANAAAGFRSRDITRKQVAADLNAKATNSGKNIDNATRQRVKWFLDPEHPERVSGFSQEEVAALNDVVRGTPTRNAIRYVGNLFGGGGGLGMALTGATGGIVGGAAGGPMGALAGVTPAAVGAGARAISNALTRRALNRADTLVRQRSPEYARRAAEAPMVPESAAAKQAIMKAILLQLAAKRKNGGGGF